jgi:hypothetical protein
MKLLVSLLAAGALLLVGCGGSSGGASSTTSSTAAGSAASAVTTSSSTASTPQPTFASSSNCQALADMGRKYVAEIQSGGGRADWGTLLKADQAMADASPSGIHSDAEYVVHTFAGFVSEMSKVGFTGGVPTASQIAALLPLESQLKSAQFVAAVDHIKAWINSNCHGVS